ncbi:uncharacterized protein DUF2059 [Cereibacter ovatus]|uniref:Uncharacterized protein DUF2059 n=1 Tax=Cereibacter ovatus TaxID=439529 RepID=A0A285D5F9_9RHOB|nr:DUF2059 domain-containing protein [Cereibacter ovatus]SNX75051.1 uncharacterized protein DUF2059 [Cereibacter ovatus]
MSVPPSLRRLAFAALLAGGAAPLMAEAPPAKDRGDSQVVAPAVQVAALGEALRIAEVVEVMREEGLEYGASLEDELFPGRGGARWQAVVGLIYDTDTMRKRFDAALEREVAADPSVIGGILDFFGSERGQRILGLEIEARRALLDESTEEAAKVVVEDMTANDDPRLGLLRDFAEANDLIELNVAGALNANLAFYRGMIEGAAFDEPMSEEQMLADVWTQEPEVRRETEEWLYPYLALAYGPLSDDDLRDYIAFSRSAEGRRLNAATFAAFDTVFSAISRDLGRAAARQMQGEDI